MAKPFRGKIVASYLYPVLVLERFLNHRLRHRLRQVATVLIIILIPVLLVSGSLAHWLPSPALAMTLGQWFSILLGLLICVLAFFLGLFSLELFFRHYIYDGRPNFWPRLVDLEVGRLFYETAEADLLLSLLLSSWGQRLALRAGLTLEDLTAFISERRARTLTSTLELKPEKILTISSFAQSLLELNPDFDQRLKISGLTTDDWRTASLLVESELRESQTAERWWSRLALGRIPGLAKDWSYGTFYHLGRYTRDLTNEVKAGGHYLASVNGLNETTKRLEDILIRRREANILLVGESNEELLDALWSLAQAVKSGLISPELEAKKVLLLNVSLLLATANTRPELEREILSLLHEGQRAGNLILAIDDLPQLVTEAKLTGSNLTALLAPYLAATNFSFIGLATKERFAEFLEPEAGLVTKFEKVALVPPTAEDLPLLLAASAKPLESESNLLFTVGALRAVAETTSRLATGGRTHDRALDLLTALASQARSRGLHVVSRDAASGILAEETHLPVGPLGPSEKSALLQLETHLGQRVIGQEAALKVIAEALRRSRLQLKNERRPIGSFLFLGPTGVGKTETAKALAKVIFGSEDCLLRLDMSEFQSSAGLAELIGGPNVAVGRLPALLRSQPYGVLLLDEFEKADRAVHDLFLQVLDEGLFTDGNGQGVNARNVIIIATSNAAADWIWSEMEAGRDPVAKSDQLIKELIKRALFKPELLNRFDAVVPYRALTAKSLRVVARILLQRLAERLQVKGLTIMIDDALIDFVVSRGSDRSFGARQIERVIQTAVDEAVAQALLTDQAKSGDTIRLVPVGDSLKVIIA